MRSKAAEAKVNAYPELVRPEIWGDFPRGTGTPKRMRIPAMSVDALNKESQGIPEEGSKKRPPCQRHKLRFSKVKLGPSPLPSFPRSPPSYRFRYPSCPPHPLARLRATSRLIPSQSSLSTLTLNRISPTSLRVFAGCRSG